MFIVKSEMFTEKGKVKPKVRTAINDGLGAKLMLSNGTEVELERNEDGKFYGIIAKNESGTPIYAKVEVAIVGEEGVTKPKEVEEAIVV